MTGKFVRVAVPSCGTSTPQPNVCIGGTTVPPSVRVYDTVYWLTWVSEKPCVSTDDGSFLWDSSVIVVIWTAAGTATFTNPGCCSMLTVMKTGASVVPCLFVHPPANASAARAVHPTRIVFLMRPSPLRPEDPRRDEDE